MVRSYLVLLLLLNYLLVVGAGLVERPARVIDRPYAYVHSHDCQLRHTLRLACFDDCNGVQYTVKKNGERLPLTQLLTTFKGLDLHCLPEGWVAVATPVFFRATPRLAAYEVAVPVGYRGQIELPPVGDESCAGLAGPASVPGVNRPGHFVLSISDAACCAFGPGPASIPRRSMNFLVHSPQPAAGAAGVVSRVQLPATGRITLMHPALRGGKALPVATSADGRDRSGGNPANHRTQHRTQCRANCMSKANF